MATLPTPGVPEVGVASSSGLALGHVPTTLRQIGILSRYQLRDYMRSRRFVILYGLVAAVAAILTGVIAYYRPPAFLTNPDALYGTAWGGGVAFVIVLTAVFFGGDAIAGEFQNKTGYFLMGQPIRRATVYVGKFLAAFTAALGGLILFALLLLANGIFYFGSGAFPLVFAESFALAVVYLLAVLGTTFLFSSLFKTSAYGTLLTAILFLFGFTILQELVSVLVKIEPWFIISYASAVIGDIFLSPYPSHMVTVTTRGLGRRLVTVTTFTPTIIEGVGIMLAYFVVTAIVGLLLFEREEFA
ncbi:MAG: ABC transporter permease [Thermoplasmata archaeon]